MRKGGKKKIEMAGAKTEGYIARTGMDSLLRLKEERSFSLSRERKEEVLKREGGSIENFLHTEDLVQSSE